MSIYKPPKKSYKYCRKCKSFHFYKSKKTKTKYTSIYWLVTANYNIKSYIIRIAEYIFLNFKLIFGLKVID